MFKLEPMTTEGCSFIYSNGEHYLVPVLETGRAKSIYDMYLISKESSIEELDNHINVMADRHIRECKKYYTYDSNEAEKEHKVYVYDQIKALVEYYLNQKHLP